MDCVLTERGFTWRGSQACGFQYWSWDLGGALHADFQAAHDASRNKGGDRIETTRRLGKTIQKVSTMLLMFAHDLGLDEDDYQGWAEYRGDLDYDLSSHLSLAADCIEYLELSFYDKFERHLELDRFNRECREDKLRKYRQAQEQRAAA
jgi:hypothetical protein